MCLAGPEFTDVRVRPGGGWMSAVQSVPVSDGTRTSLVVWSLADGDMRTFPVDPAPATGRGMSGGVTDWHPDGTSLVYVSVSGSLHRLNVRDGTVATVNDHEQRRWWGPVHSPDGEQLAAVDSWRELCRLDPVGNVHLVHTEHDGYVMDAAWFGDRTVAHRWSRPEMAWTTSGLTGVDEREGVSVQQPRSSAATIGWISDESGVWNVWIDGVPVDDGCEHAGPSWGPGQRTWCFNSDASAVAYVRNEFGFGSLWVMDRATGRRTLVGRGVHGCLSWSGDTLAALRSGARTAQEAVVYDVSDLSEPRRTHRFTPPMLRWDEFAADLVEPTVHAAGEVPYRLYGAAVPNGRLIVWVHGGPNDQWQVTWRPRFTYWLSRGYSIVVPDHRGSTGHGRDFRRMLDGAWGVLDADDTALVTRHAQAEFGFRPEDTVLMGASAGGLSVLSAAARHAGLAACAVVSYPVADLSLLLACDDPFEGHHNRRLVGDASVSPVSQPGHLAVVPVLSFHGDIDELVVPDHSFRLHEAVNAAGGSVDVVMMQGEGHGFRNPTNIVREFGLTEEFLEQHLG